MLGCIWILRCCTFTRINVAWAYFYNRETDMQVVVAHDAQYKPRKGDALLFWSLHVNGTFDKHALHGGCPVRSGMKWVATKWIRDKCLDC